MKWSITYYNDRVYNEIRGFPLKMGARYLALTDAMQTHGPNLGMPHTRAMGDGLYEIRIKAQEGIARVFYCVQVEHEIVILHSFIKKTQKTPEKELDIALKRLREVKKHG